MRIDINLDNQKEDAIHHQTMSYQDGDWIIFKCAQCPDYERRINWKTGKMFCINIKPEIMHQGFHCEQE